MGSIVEVLHFPSAIMGADQHQNHHTTPHRSTPRRLPPSESSSSSSSTVQPSQNDDTVMTDVMPPPNPPPPSSSSTISSSRPAAPSRRTFSSSRDLTFHSSGGSQATIRVKSSPKLKSSPSIHTSPINVQSQPPSISSRGKHSSSVTSSVQNSPSINTQSPRSNRSPPSPPRIKVKSLSHIQSFVIDDANPLSPSRTSSRISMANGRDLSPQYEISEMPVAEIIEMVAGLLTKITTTNDRQHEYLHQHSQPSDTQGMNQQATSVLAFHGKNVPSISILSYLSRIHKYCPTTYEVFLSLLVYFDRMTERVNSGPIQSLRQANQQSLERHVATAAGQSADFSSQGQKPPPVPQQNSSQQASTPPSSGSLGHTQEQPRSALAMPPSPPMGSLDAEPTSLAHFFVVDSFNIHRLVIAGVTCASKFFSDIFYTNSRYAKVGGLPLAELNHLELQFLLLNDFRLAVPLEEMEAYGTMLVEFYAREVLAQQTPASRSTHTLGES